MEKGRRNFLKKMFVGATAVAMQGCDIGMERKKTIVDFLCENSFESEEDLLKLENRLIEEAQNSPGNIWKNGVIDYIEIFKEQINVKKIFETAIYFDSKKYSKKSSSGLSIHGNHYDVEKIKNRHKNILLKIKDKFNDNVVGNVALTGIMLRKDKFDDIKQEISQSEEDGFIVDSENAKLLLMKKYNEEYLFYNDRTKLLSTGEIVDSSKLDLNEEEKEKMVKIILKNIGDNNSQIKLKVIIDSWLKNESLLELERENFIIFEDKNIKYIKNILLNREFIPYLFYNWTKLKDVIPDKLGSEIENLFSIEEIINYGISHNLNNHVIGERIKNAIVNISTEEDWSFLKNILEKESELMDVIMDKFESEEHSDEVKIKVYSKLKDFELYNEKKDNILKKIKNESKNEYIKVIVKNELKDDYDGENFENDILNFLEEIDEVDLNDIIDRKIDFAKIMNKIMLKDVYEEEEEDEIMVEKIIEIFKSKPELFLNSRRNFFTDKEFVEIYKKKLFNSDKEDSLLLERIINSKISVFKPITRDILNYYVENIEKSNVSPKISVEIVNFFIKSNGYDFWNDITENKEYLLGKAFKYNNGLDYVNKIKSLCNDDESKKEIDDILSVVVNDAKNKIKNSYNGRYDDINSDIFPIDIEEFSSYVTYNNYKSSRMGKGGESGPFIPWNQIDDIKDLVKNDYFQYELNKYIKENSDITTKTEFFSLIIGCSRSNIYKNDKNDKSIKLFFSNLKKIKKEVIFDEKTESIVISHNEMKHSNIKKKIKGVSSKLSGYNSIVIENQENVNKKDFLKKISQITKKTNIVIEGHGEDKLVNVGVAGDNNGDILYTELMSAINMSNNQDKINLLVDSCYGYNFLSNLMDSMDKINGVKPLNISFSPANIGNVTFGHDKVYNSRLYEQFPDHGSVTIGDLIKYQGFETMSDAAFFKNNSEFNKRT